MQTTYKVYRNGEVIAEGLTDKSFKDESVEPSTAYTYRVAKVTAAGEQFVTEEINVKTPAKRKVSTKKKQPKAEE